MSKIRLKDMIMHRNYSPTRYKIQVAAHTALILFAVSRWRTEFMCINEYVSGSQRMKAGWCE